MPFELEGAEDFLDDGSVMAFVVERRLSRKIDSEDQIQVFLERACMMRFFVAVVIARSRGTVLVVDFFRDFSIDVLAADYCHVS